MRLAAVAFLVLAAAAGTSAPSPSASRVSAWRPRGVSSPAFESHAAFDPSNGDLYFVRSSPRFEGWRILTSRCSASGWSEPRPADFAGPGVEADPYFAEGGRTLWFISTRATGSARSRDLDIWRVERDAHGKWGPPERLPEPVNSPGAEWFPRPAPDGWLYFGSDRPGGAGGNDIWRAKRDAGGAWIAENLGAPVDSPADEYEPLPSPDGSRLIVMAGDGLFETRRTPAGGWSGRTKLLPDGNGTEIGALFSPSGRTLLFSRDTGAPESGEFFVLRGDGGEDWPPDCPARR